MKFNLVLCAILLWSSLSCREKIVSNADAEKERLIVGSWSLSFIEPPSTSSIELTFRPDFTMRVVIISSDTTTDDEYGYVIADGQISYFTDDVEGLLGVIESLDDFQMVLLVPSSGFNFRETYSRL